MKSDPYLRRLGQSRIENCRVLGGEEEERGGKATEKRTTLLTEC